MFAGREERGVISMVERSLQAQLSRVEAYWQALRPQSGALPKRSDFNPQGVAECLSSVMLLERIAPTVLRVRIAGMTLCDLMGMDLRGMPLNALIGLESRTEFAKGVERVFDGPSRVEIQLRGEAGFGRAPISARLLMLPMLGHQGEVSRSLAFMGVEGEVTSRPQRFTVVGTSVRRIEGLPASRPIPAQGHWAPYRARPEPQGMAEAAIPFAGAKRSERPWLRLVKSD